MELGKRFVIEGTDGTGKTTIANMITWQLRQNNIDVIRIDEPDSAYDVNGTVLVPMASDLRKLIKDGSIERTPEANLALFNASRFANWTYATQPAMLKGIWAGQARDEESSQVYQGHAEGMGMDQVRNITRQVMGDQYMNPDYKVILDFEDHQEDIRTARISNRGPLDKPDTFESRDDTFQRKLREGYRILAARDNLEIISAHQSKEAIADQVWARMMGKFGMHLALHDWKDYRLAA